MKKIKIAFLFSLFIYKIVAQNTNKSTIIDQNELKEILSREHKSYHKLTYTDYENDPNGNDINYYVFENKDLIIEEKNKENIITVYDDELSLYENLNDTSKKALTGSFFGKRKIVEKLDLYNNIVLDELFQKLCLDKEKKLRNVDLKLFNQALEDFGYNECLNNLYLHLIVFTGEYLKEKYNTGHWEFERIKIHPFESIPHFVFNKKDLAFAINASIHKNLIYALDGEDDNGDFFGEFDIKEILKLCEAYIQVSLPEN